MEKKTLRKSIAILFSLLIAAGMIFNTGFTAEADSGENAASGHKNLVAVVRFSDDTAETYNGTYSYNSYYTYWQQFKCWFEAGNIPYFDNGTTSLAAYMSAISNGAWSLTSYFPQSGDDYTDPNPYNTNTNKTVTGKTMTYITLPHNEAYYESAGDLQLVEDAAAIFNTHTDWTAGSSSWGSGGVLDNLELIVQVSEEPDTSNTLLWPHKSNASGAAAFGGMKVYEYNLVNSKAVADLGTVKHEYLHTAGLGDLYRVGDTSANPGPVGIWDIMGSAAGQWPLAQSLVDLGFESADAIKTISGSGTKTVTLHTHYSAEDDGQAVKVYSPYSTEEYFVFEYRQKDKDSLTPDRLVPSSGLIIYRVNNAVEKDVNGHRTNRISTNGYYEDGIYVFRPGETGIHDSAGSLMKAALSTGSYAYLNDTANARSAFGTADMTKTIADGAIVDSSDNNSGIVVTVTAQTDDSVTFNLEIPDYSALSLWNGVGTAASSELTDCVSTAADSNGVIYQSYTDNSTSVRVRAWNGSAWTGLGSAAEVSDGLGHASLQCIGSDLYCCYSSYSSSGPSYNIMKWGGGTNWTKLAGISSGNSYANAPDSAVLGGSLYVLADKDNTGAQIYKLNVSGSTGTLAAVGDPLSIGYATEEKLGMAGDCPVVACGDVGSNYSSETGENIYIYKDGSWQKLFSETANVARNIATVSVGSAMLSFASYDKGTTPKLFLVSGDTAHTVTSYDFSAAGTDITDADLFASGNYVYLTATDGSGKTVTWYAGSNDLAKWTQLGAVTFSNASQGSETVSALAYGTKAYAGLINSSYGEAVLVSHDLIPEAENISFEQTEASGTVKKTSLMLRMKRSATLTLATANGRTAASAASTDEKIATALLSGNTVTVKGISYGKVTVEGYSDQADKASCLVTVYLGGDVNEDNAVDVSDLQEVAKNIVGLTVFDEEQTVRGNYDESPDGGINVSDLQGIAKYIVGLDG